ncbi:predicted protein [Methanosarcina acetivorans C2A]|uniref:Uncharacterized protein n=1 Tax=Methanosarcina acetivorans (strain ATCC 35395 / DSM 2834 / JCM 12185 / C2A) TaxID=188937 RepID=Q8TKZ9_METAC|nr:predicted protein [Methanosarcina acetivorans C2A]
MFIFINGPFFIYFLSLLLYSCASRVAALQCAVYFGRVATLQCAVCFAPLKQTIIGKVSFAQADYYWKSELRSGILICGN